MQKKLIALAIAGLSGAAFAQSNVTIYGVADVGFENVSAGGPAVSFNGAHASNDIPNKFRTTTNSSLIGFKGVEDLGNGLKAVFQFENTITLNGGVNATGTSTTNNIFGAARDTYAALAGNFGTVAGGILTGPTRKIGADVDMNPGATGVGFTGSIFGEILGIKTGSDDRFTNAVAYISPNFNGFYGILGYVPNSNKNNAGNPAAAAPAPAGAYTPTRNDNKYDLGLFYENGPLYLAYSHIDAKDPAVLGAIVGQGQAVGVLSSTLTQIGTFNDELKVDRLAGKYKFGDTTVSALWDRQKYEFSNATLADAGAVPPVPFTTGQSGNLERKAWQLAVKQDFGNQSVWAQYAKANKTTSSGSDLSNTGAKQITVGYDYAFSKRTMLKAYYSTIQNDANNATDFYVSGVGGVTRDADPRAIGVALRTTF